MNFLRTAIELWIVVASAPQAGRCAPRGGASRAGSLQISEQEPWMSVDVVAKHLGIARDTVYRWIDTKGLPDHRIGRLWKSKRSDIDKWGRAGGANEDDDTKECFDEAVDRG